ncbi:MULTISPECIES: hypothetical protein [Xanthomonas]|uniref:hypothetical protein n=1 Tax=Xanthomonas TaxID=338 RepID=UPI0011C06749|nr:MULTISPECIES: hypothetical protein [Xanthomonas]CAD1790839.1 hypothetical protein XSP_001760 [Xanthomonas sp. CPBF 426]CAE1135476.1 hypothetical protein XTG_001730 [Xanthomonas euroxanthea]CAG2088736.1 hypothetical protein XCY_001725 [Xanthomonas euroxanthea]
MTQIASAARQRAVQQRGCQTKRGDVIATVIGCTSASLRERYAALADSVNELKAEDACCGPAIANKAAASSR